VHAPCVSEDTLTAVLEGPNLLKQMQILGDKKQLITLYQYQLARLIIYAARFPRPLAPFNNQYLVSDEEVCASFHTATVAS
jgi:hypothetical protein